MVYRVEKAGEPWPGWWVVLEDDIPVEEYKDKDKAKRRARQLEAAHKRITR